MSPQFGRGDLVVHPRRPEWGSGVVEQAEAIVHDGQPAQRIVVTFQAHGRVTINTGVAPLLSKDAAEIMNRRLEDSTMTVSSNTSSYGASRSGSASEAGQGWLGKLEAKTNGDPLRRLVAALTDPFETEFGRLKATVESFRHGEDPVRNPRGLIDWAVEQTGMADPLTKYTRHELEDAFRYWVRMRDEHLKKLVFQLKRASQGPAVQQLAQQTRYATAKMRLERALRA
ncbi:MAG: DUF3553 domain-containing protein [Phycisphaeraceae bacterium]|nr:DUF3553 domain-containing protein [Phycisphaeraceae bacterium]